MVFHIVLIADLSNNNDVFITPKVIKQLNFLKIVLFTFVIPLKITLNRFCWAINNFNHKT